MLIYESGTHRRQAGPAAAVDRGRHARRDGGRGRQRARGLQLLAAARKDRRRVPQRRPDRPLRQYQHHRDRRRLRPPTCPPPRRGRRARDRSIVPRRSSWWSGRPCGPSSIGWTSSPRSASATEPATASGLDCTGSGPRVVITDLGVLRPHPETMRADAGQRPPRVDAPSRRRPPPGGRSRCRRISRPPTPRRDTSSPCCAGWRRHSGRAKGRHDRRGLHPRRGAHADRPPRRRARRVSVLTTSPRMSSRSC